MLGFQVPHPPSTNYHDDFPIPEAKRLRRYESNDSIDSVDRQSSADEKENTPPGQNKPRVREIADSEADSDEDNYTPDVSRPTDLESALPVIKTDKEAIQEYEHARAEESAQLDLKGRLGQRKWVPGKSSIYVDAFNLALETVLEDESHLFDEAEMDVFENWRNLSYEGQYLYMTIHVCSLPKG